MSDAIARCRALVSALGLRYGMPDLALDEASHSCVLAYDARLRVWLTADAGRDCLLLWTMLGGLDAHARPDLMLAMLEANCMWQHTHGATLGYDGPQGQVLLSLALATAALDGALLEQTLERFVETALAWQARLDAPPPGTLNPAWLPSLV